MVREGLLDSNSYAILSTEAKLLYVHLLLLADDFGCVGMSETFLRRRAFHDAPSGRKIAALVTELTDADLVRCYDADRACYAFIPKFRQRLQRQTLKHPLPPESLYQDDSYARELFNKYSDNLANPTVAQPLANRAPTVAQPLKRSEEKRSKPLAQTAFARFWVAYPRKKSKGQAEKAFLQLHPDEQLHEAILMALERAKTSDDWTRENGRFVPYPASWLNARGWEDEDAAKPDGKFKVAL